MEGHWKDAGKKGERGRRAMRRRAGKSGDGKGKTRKWSRKLRSGIGEMCERPWKKVEKERGKKSKGESAKSV